MMRKIETHSFAIAKQQIDLMMKATKPFHRSNWQGLDVSNKPEMAIHELRHVSIDVDLRGVEDLGWYRSTIKPNLPWADDHFEERVCGYPLNPGTQWKHWPWGQSADKFREASGIFNHSYAERYWPIQAESNPAPTLTAEDFARSIIEGVPIKQGIRGRYGDLNDVVAKLINEPTTRQAILPVYFPEDTALLTGRQPCSMYYHFMLDDKKRLDVVYPMRSCDYRRHWADDVYMTVRLLIWVLERARKHNAFFDEVKPGQFVMHIANLHVFRNDYTEMFK
jgi:hypothetical protein